MAMTYIYIYYIYMRYISSWHVHTTSIDIYIQSLWRIQWIPKWHTCQNSKATWLTMTAWEQTRILQKWTLTNALYCRHRASNITECKFKHVSLLSACCLYTDFSVSQSIDESIRCVYGTYCMSLGSFSTPQGRSSIHLSEVRIIFSAAVCTIHCTMGLWKFCIYIT